MGLADINFSELTSIKQRASIGKRIFKSRLQSAQKDDKGNIISWLWNGAKQLGGFLLSEAGKFLSWSFSSLWGFITSTIQFIWNFDWNMTDDSIDQQIQARWNAIGGQLGGVLGNAFGYLACSVLPGAVIFCFNEPLGAYVLKNATEEFAEEFFENVGALSKSVFQAGVQNLLMWSYKNVRKFIKSQSQLIGKIFGKNTERVINAWGEKGSQPWSFAIALENAVESIPNEFVRNFVEEFLEESWEACVEAGYVVGNSLDSYYAQKKLEKQVEPVLGAERHVEITFDREYPDLKIALGGQEELVKSQVISAMTTYQIVRDKDVGVIFGSEIKSAIQDKRFRPHFYLIFQEVRDASNKGKRLREMEISFRLMNETSESITYEEILGIKNKISSKFENPQFVIEHGITPYSYVDNQGNVDYQMLLYVTGEQEARRVVEQVLDIRALSPNWDKLCDPSKPVTGRKTIGEKRVILGESKRANVRGWTGKAVFIEAYCYLHGDNQPISLISLRRRKAKKYSLEARKPQEQTE